MSMELVLPEAVVENEIARGATRRDVAMTYALALRTSGPVDWRRINRAIRERWSESGLVWIKTRAHAYVEGRREFGS